MDNQGMIDYFFEQPKRLNELKEDSHHRVSVFQEFWEKERPDRLYLIGSGTSYHALNTVYPFMERFLGIEVTIATPTQLLRIRGAKPAIILVSQSGASTNTLRAAKILKGITTMALTGETSSPLSAVTDLHLNLGIGKEKAGPKTVGYTATVLFLLYASLYGGISTGQITATEFQEALTTLSSAVEAIPENIRRTQAWFNRNQDDLVKIRKYIIVGKGAAAAVAGEGALKILETVRVPASGYEFEEYLHGPILQMDAELGGIYYCTGDEDRERINALARLHMTVSPYVFRIFPISGEGNGHDLVLLQTREEYTKGIELVYPCQIIGALVPQLAQRDQGRNFFREYVAMHQIKVEE